MCGVAVIISRTSTIKTSHIIGMLNLIKHRGPDGEGYVLIDLDELVYNAGGDDTSEEVWAGKSPYQPIFKIQNLKDKLFRIALGHRRLSIIDLSVFGHLPMCAVEQRYWITYNGEIYNYIELREELEALGYTFHSATDTEVILMAYQHWGVECQERFNGMWAFVIYDRITDEIFMSRDRFGIKPLYYWFSPEGNFCVGSEIKQFTAISGWQARINPQRCYDYLVYSYTDHTDETMFLGVNQLPGGCYFKVSCKDINPDSRGKIDWVKWYELKEEKYQDSFENASLEFKNLFKKAVKLQLRSDVAIGSSLSGGIDSSAIVCQIVQELEEENSENLLKTFSSRTYDSRFDEGKWINAVVDFVKIDSHVVYPKLEDLFKVTHELIWHQDEPYQSQSAFLGFHVFELAKQKEVKVVFSGQGADEYLGGYNQFTSARFNKLLGSFKWREIGKEVIHSGEYTKYKYSTIMKNFIISRLPKKIRARIITKVGSYKEIKKLVNVEILKSVHINPNEIIPEKLDTVKNISKHLLFYSTLPKYLRWEDRNSMAHSIEARVPFLDHELVEFCYNLPEEYLDFNGETKRTQRSGLKDILPKGILDRKDKMGFITPEQKWVIEDNPGLFRNKIIEAIEITKGIIQPEALLYFDKIVLKEIPFDYTYWRIILFAEWMKCFNISIEERSSSHM
jgi:asparagine synthase (glutamine-hydrolysing)